MWKLSKSSVPFISKDILDPGSTHMGVIGLLYKQSYMLKEFKEMLTEEYEFSYWVPNVLFAVVCILLGILAAFFVLLPGLLSVSPLKIPFIVIILSLFLYPQWSLCLEIVQKLRNEIDYIRLFCVSWDLSMANWKWPSFAFLIFCLSQKGTW